MALVNSIHHKANRLTFFIDFLKSFFEKRQKHTRKSLSNFTRFQSKYSYIITTNSAKDDKQLID